MPANDPRRHDPPRAGRGLGCARTSATARVPPLGDRRGVEAGLGDSSQRLPHGSTADAPARRHVGIRRWISPSASHPSRGTGNPGRPRLGRLLKLGDEQKRPSAVVPWDYGRRSLNLCRPDPRRLPPRGGCLRYLRVILRCTSNGKTALEWGKRLSDRPRSVTTLQARLRASLASHRSGSASGRATGLCRAFRGARASTRTPTPAKR